jgi:hypothetical protein
MPNKIPEMVDSSVTAHAINGCNGAGGSGDAAMGGELRRLNVELGPIVMYMLYTSVVQDLKRVCRLFGDLSVVYVLFLIGLTIHG